MQTTTNYGFNIVEGTDIVNPLTQLNPNFTALDSDLKAVSDNTIDRATCIKTGTVHAVTRVNTSANVFRFTATGNWNTGDTMTVDGTLVSVYATNGTAPADSCFVINTEVIAAIQGTRVTLYVNSVDASSVAFDDSNVSYTANNVQTAIDNASTAAGTQYSSGISVKDKLDWVQIGTNITDSSPAIDVSDYSEIYVVPKLAGFSMSAPLYIVKISNNFNIGNSYVETGSYKLVYRVTITLDQLTLTYTLDTWTSVTFDVYAKK